MTHTKNFPVNTIGTISDHSVSKCVIVLVCFFMITMVCLIYTPDYWTKCSLAPHLMLFTVLGLLGYVDYKVWKLPNLLLLFYALLAIIFFCDFRSLLSLYGIFTLLALGSGLKMFCLWRKRTSGLGIGDIKFLSLSGLIIPLEEIPLFLMAIGILGYGWGYWMCRKNKSCYFAFGPVIASVLAGWILIKELVL